MRRRNEKGQALLLVVLALGIFMIGAVGLAVDGAQMYGHRQMRNRRPMLQRKPAL